MILSKGSRKGRKNLTREGRKGNYSSENLTSRLIKYRFDMHRQSSQQYSAPPFF